MTNTLEGPIHLPEKGNPLPQAKGDDFTLIGYWRKGNGERSSIGYKFKNSDGVVSISDMEKACKFIKDCYDHERKTDK